MIVPSRRSALRLCASLCACLLVGHSLGAPAGKSKPKDTTRGEHRFAIVGHVYANATGDAALEKALANTRKSDLSFVVATGIKAASEPCTDQLYAHRREMLQAAKRPVVVVPAAASNFFTCALRRSMVVSSS